MPSVRVVPLPVPAKFTRSAASAALALLPWLTVPSALAAPGDVDLTFNPSPDAGLQASATQPDNKLVFGGSFQKVGAVTRYIFARLNADASLDTAYNPNAGANPANTGQIYTCIVQPDGKVFVGGGIGNFGGAQRFGAARVNADGTLDTNFNPNTDGVISSAIQSDGKLLIGGDFVSVGGVAKGHIARLNTNGTLDTTFTATANSSVYGISVQPDGKIVIGGSFVTVNGVTRNRVARVNADGTLDTSFNPNVGDTGDDVDCTTLQADGKILIAGRFDSVGGTTRNNIARLNANGSLDTAFNPNVTRSFNPLVLTMNVQCDGKIVIGGAFNSVRGTTRNNVARLNADGTLDTAFTVNGSGAEQVVYQSTLQADGRIILAGYFQNVGGAARKYLARLTNDAATQTLTVNAQNSIQWLRGGSSPETTATTYELSTNGGASWTMLGQGSRIAGGWQLTGLSLPPAGVIRARARNFAGTSTGILESTASFTFPEISVFAGANTTAPELTDGQTSVVTFPPARRGAAAAPELPFTVSNTGALPLQINSITLPAGYALSSPPVFPVTVAVNTAFTLSVRLSTANSGTFAGSIVINNNDTNETVFDFPVTGSIVSPEITVKNEDAPGGPEVISGQVQPVRIVTQRLGEMLGVRVTVTNTGNANLILSGISIAAPFTATTVTSGIPQTIQPGRAESIFIRLNAPAAGDYAANLTILSDDDDEGTFLVPIAGTVISPEITVHDGAAAAPELTDNQEAVVNFGTARQGTPVVRTFTIVNTGSAPLAFAAMTVPPGFTLLNPPAFSLLAINDSYPLQIRLDAAATGTFQGTVSLGSDDFDEPAFDFSVAGTVVTPEISVHDGATSAAPALTDGQTAPVDFGRNVQGTPGVRSFTIANTGTAPLLVSSVTLPPGFTVLNLPPLPAAVGISQALTFQAALSTLTPGTSSGSVVIASDDLDEALFDFPVTGEVFIPEPVAAVVAAATTLNRQSGLREQTIHISNDTTATVPAYNLIIRGLPAGVEVNNASSTRADGSVVVYIRTALTPHSAQDIVLEYFTPDRALLTVSPQLSTEVVPVPPSLTVAPGEAGLAIETIHRLAGGEILIEFTTLPGRRYEIQYSADGQSWQTSLPAIRAAANRTQWIDRGLPRTESHPSLAPTRLFRVRGLAP